MRLTAPAGPPGCRYPGWDTPAPVPPPVPGVSPAHRPSIVPPLTGFGFQAPCRSGVLSVFSSSSFTAGPRAVGLTMPATAEVLATLQGGALGPTAQALGPRWPGGAGARALAPPPPRLVTEARPRAGLAYCVPHHLRFRQRRPRSGRGKQGSGVPVWWAGPAWPRVLLGTSRRRPS